MPPLIICIWVGMLLVGGLGSAQYQASKDFQKQQHVQVRR